jgi:hypothetical protein
MDNRIGFLAKNEVWGVSPYILRVIKKLLFLIFESITFNIELHIPYLLYYVHDDVFDCIVFKQLCLYRSLLNFRVCSLVITNLSA